MELDEHGMAIAAAFVALIGIAMLFLLSETPKSASIADALLAPEKTLLEVRGNAANSTTEKFLLCESYLCISVRKNSVPSAELVADGRRASVLGRVKEYKGSRYIEAERVGMDG